MIIRKHLAGIVVALVVAAGGGYPVHTEPLRIRYGIWVGYGPLFVAQEKGFFDRESADVELIRIDDLTAAFASLFDDQVDGMMAGTPDLVTFYARQAESDDEPLVCVLVTDDSRGGDGILATKDIQSIADLRGRSVAFLRGSVVEFYLKVLLKEAGLSEADIEVVDLPSDDATTAFMLQEVDAVVTYEPYLSQGKSAAHGHLLTDTSQHPGLLTACLFVKASVFEQRKAEFRTVARAWDAAVHFVEAHPNEATTIMARHVGGWLEDPAVFAETLRGVRLYDAEQNRKYFGTPDRPGPIYQTIQQAIEIWSGADAPDRQLAPADMIRPDLWVD
jgi:NitT/TauT family transport system substrate-binding protein